MDDKKIKKISKRQLLEILLSQSKRIEELELELAQAKKEVASKKIQLEESGSIAEASLRLNRIFEIAQETADQYLINVQEKCKELEQKAQEELEKAKKKNVKQTKTNSKRRTSKISMKKRYNSKANDNQEQSEEKKSSKKVKNEK